MVDYSLYHRRVAGCSEQNKGLIKDLPDKEKDW